MTSVLQPEPINALVREETVPDVDVLHATLTLVNLEL